MVTKTLILDCETSGLISPEGNLPASIWCICTEELETGETRDFILDEVYKDFPLYAKEFDFFIAHNAVGFDIPVLTGKTDFSCKLSQVIDTKILSSLFNPDRPEGHSLKSWGERVGDFKGDYTDWTHYTEEMLKYCRQDVSVLRKTYFRLLQEKKAFNISNRSIRLEHLIALYIRDMGWNGFAVDLEKIDTLYEEVARKSKEHRELISQNFKPLPKPIRVITPRYKKDGTLSVIGLKKLEARWPSVSGDFTLIEWIPFNIDSPKQIVQRLNILGWKPTDKTKGHIKVVQEISRGLRPKEDLEKFKEYGWKVNEENLGTLPEDAPKEAQLIADYLMLDSRRNLIDTQWFPNIREDGKIHGRCNPLGAGTNRMTHSGPNMANIPAVKLDKEENPLKGFEGKYGWDSRDCFTVSDPTKYSLFGDDATGLELRILAHYMNNPEFTKTLLEGDIHKANQAAAGLKSKAEAKTFIYGFLFGAGAAKLGSIVGGGYIEGLRLKEQFLASYPDLSKLIKRVQEDVKKYGYVQGLDGRVLWVRSPHAALNTLLQGNGAIVCKWWLHYRMIGIAKYKIDAKLVGTSHDEYQSEVLKDHIGMMGKISKAAMKKTERVLGLRCPLDCNWKEGRSWAETH